MNSRFWLGLGCLLWTLACSKAPAPPGPAAPDQDPSVTLRLWNRGVLELDRHEFVAAQKTFAEVVSRLPEDPDARINYGIACMNQVRPELFREAEVAYTEALRLDPSSLPGHHCLGVLLKHLGRGAEAIPHFEAVLAKDPHDPTANYYLATLKAAAGDRTEAEKLLRRALASEPHQSSALLQLFRILQRSDRAAEGETLLATFEAFEKAETGNKAGIVYHEMGHYGEAIRQPRLRAPAAATPPVPLELATAEWRFGNARAPDAPGSPKVPSGDWLSPAMAFADVDQDGDLDVYLANPEHAGHLLRNDRGKLVDASREWGLSGDVKSLQGTFGDIDNDGDPDLYVAGEGQDRLFLWDQGKYRDITTSAGLLGDQDRSAGAVFADLDADGDLDLYVAAHSSPGARRSRLWNNNRDGTFTDIAERAGAALPGAQCFSVIAADLDRDRDADLLVLTETGPVVLRNDRIWRFVDVTESAFRGKRPRARSALVHDANEDGFPDLVLNEWEPVQSSFWSGEARLSFAPVGTPVEGSVIAASADLDQDGSLEVVTISASALSSVHRFSGPAPISAPVQGPPRPAGLRAACVVDLDQDGVAELITAHAGPGLASSAWTGVPAGQWIEIEPRGVREVGKMRTNTGGIGAWISITAGTTTQSREVINQNGGLCGPPPRARFGLGSHREADYVRIVWPDDVVQGEPMVPTGQRTTVTQVYRKGSSCPLLFVWNGERFEFVTDFLGTGGLGFFLSPGVYAPPDPTEDVLIPTLVPKDGRLHLRIHEPMEEVVYLDQIQLLEIDAPAGLTVIPDERLAVNAPAPDGRFIVFREADRRLPVGLRTRQGDADPKLLHAVDRRYQPGILPDRRFLGFAAPQEIEVDFGSALRDAPSELPLVLVLDGWVEYPYSHVNFAAGQAGLQFRALSLDVEILPGQWEVFAEEFGYPAGMPRTMTLDVSRMPRHGTGRLRLRTNIELGIDRLALVTDLGPASLTITTRDPERADLRRSGYPREYSPDGAEPLLYDYSLMDPAIDFKNLEGDYTRFGDVSALLPAFDDRYVIFGRGEEIALEFVASPPPAAGHTRTFVLRTAGYCKDMDLYTAFPHTIEPLPFKTMPSYPYGPGLSFPRGEVFERDAREFHTRRLRGSRMADSDTR